MGNDAFGHGRREVVFLLGSAAAASILGCTNDSSDASTPDAATPSSGSTCIVRPQQTEGPYFVDERLERSDIRSDPSNGSVRPGSPLRLAFRVSRVAGAACTPIAGALVDVWQTDAQGVYSDVVDGAFNTRGQKFLRGFQLTDAAGLAQFMTIYPGWYSGRAVHIHFKIRTTPGAASGLEFTSQIYFDETLTDQVHAQAPYNGRGRRNTSNTTDGIFRSGGSQLLLPLVPDGAGHQGTFDIALQG
jgi:protocatechuate 3,4-dioxygenase beta subunit